MAPVRNPQAVKAANRKKKIANEQRRVDAETLKQQQKCIMEQQERLITSLEADKKRLEEENESLSAKIVKYKKRLEDAERDHELDRKIFVEEKRALKNRYSKKKWL